MSGRGVGLAALDPELLDKIQPTTLSRDRLLDVPAALEGLFPWGGLQRGTTIGMRGSAAWVVAAAMLAPSLGDEGWMAIVGADHLNLVAAAEMGVRLDRILVVDVPPTGQWGSVVVSLLEAVQAVVVSPPTRVGGRDVRRIGARLRELRGNVVHLDGSDVGMKSGGGASSSGASSVSTWPSPFDLRIECDTRRWHGLGDGHGYLRHRVVDITATGRRQAAKPRSVSVWLPGPDGPLSPADPPEVLAPVSPIRAAGGP